MILAVTSILPSIIMSSNTSPFVESTFFQVYTSVFFAEQSLFVLRYAFLSLL